MNERIISVEGLSWDYRIGNVVVPALRGVDLEVHRGEFASVVGASGCGKSTLLYILGGMLRATKGSVWIDGFDMIGARSASRTRFLRKNLGFVFQRFNLISSLNVFDNLKIACKIAGSARGYKEKIDGMLRHVGIEHKARMKPLELSQGEQQRVAIARALIKEPKILLADEPTGNLDSENSEKILALFRTMNRDLGQTILMITHNRRLADMTDRTFEMKDGKILSNGTSPRQTR
ncbi:MAG: ABC transporter ATP-binding protein [Desulfobacteraceae bacterium]|nr:ABC transporter ATP-binding protein [Desulfobacteraceae bacterium]